MNRYAWLILLVVGCGAPHHDSHGEPHGRPVEVRTHHQGAGPIEVVCTTGMVADLVRTIGAERVQVTQLMGEGVDPHLYKPSPGDVAKLEGASLIFFNGLHLEGKMGELFARLARRKTAIAVGEHLPPSLVLKTEGVYDPHIWFDVSLWRQVGDIVRDTLVAHDPGAAEGYRSRHEGNAKKMDELHRWAREQLQTVPESRRVLVTAHDAFRYFGRAYGVEVRGIQGVSTESEAGVRDVNDLVDYLVERKIKAVFVESSVPERNVRAILEGASSRGHKVIVGGELFSDAMGQPGTPEGTYEGMVRHNVRIIVEGLK